MLDSRPSLDKRYAVGWCPRCTPLKVARPGRPEPKRSTVILALDTPDARQAIADRDRRKAERKLVEKVIRNDVPEGVRGDALRRQATEIRTRWADEAAARRST